MHNEVEKDNYKMLSIIIFSCYLEGWWKDNFQVKKICLGKSQACKNNKKNISKSIWITKRQEFCSWLVFQSFQ